MSSVPPPPPPPPLSPPPGYAAYGGPGSYGGTFQRIGSLTKALVTLSVIGIVASAASLVVQLTLRPRALDFRDGTITLDEFADKLGPYLAVSAVLGLVGLATLVVQIIWTFRIAKNLAVLGRKPRAFSPGGSIAVNILGGCTLGILPYFMWRELWKGSDSEVPPGDSTWKQRPVGTIVHLWFAATILTFVVSLALGVGSAITRVNRGSDSSLAKQLDDQFAFILVSGILSIITAVLFVGLVRQLAARHMQATREA
ncbi:MAG: DUF4328 domain-containing protein [Ilumatobacteraceae bacterium]